MKKGYLAVFVLLSCFCSACTIDYESYYDKYGDISNKDHRLNSEKIEETIKNYPSSNQDILDKYSEVYADVSSDYVVYATYYSTEYDTLYISYDSIVNPSQTIASKGLALIEEHLLNYFVSNSAKSDYKDYLKAVRIYPDYHSSTCRTNVHTEAEYSIIEGCANYNAYEASINLNNMVDIDRFFDDYIYEKNGYTYRLEPKRDTFAHEFGHVSTYYNMILKGDDSYKDYLKLRLGEAYDEIYPNGLPDTYSSGLGYNIQPVEILADDYVELFYDTSKKVSTDYYDYELEYDDLRNSLSGVDNVVHHLKDDQELFNDIEEYYQVYINKEYTEYEIPIIVNANGDTYNDLHDINDDKKVVTLNNNPIIALGEISINNIKYYRVVLSNVVMKSNVRNEYSNNIGYILKSECSIVDGKVVYFNQYDGDILKPNVYLPIKDDVNIYPYYDFSYFIHQENKLKLYNYLDADFEELDMLDEKFIIID